MTDLTGQLRELFSRLLLDDVGQDERELARLSMLLYLGKVEEVESYLQESDKSKGWVRVQEAVRLVRGEGYIFTQHGIAKSLHASLSASQQTKALQAISDVLNDIRNSFGLPAYLTSGTLLGIERDGRLIQHDDDIDSAYVSRAQGYLNWAMEWNALAGFLGTRSCLVSKHLPGLLHVTLGLEGGTTIRFDLFSSLVENGFINEYPLEPGKLSADRVEPVAVRRFLDADVVVPRDPAALLEVNYGPGWRVPDPTFRFDWNKSAANYRDRIRGMSASLPSPQWLREQVPVTCGDWRPDASRGFTDYKMAALQEALDQSQGRNVLVVGLQNEQFFEQASNLVRGMGGRIHFVELDAGLDEPFGDYSTGSKPFISNLLGREGVLFGDEKHLRETLGGLGVKFDLAYLDTCTRQRTHTLASVITHALADRCAFVFDDFIFESAGRAHLGQYQAVVTENCFADRSLRAVGRTQWSQVVMRSARCFIANHTI